MNKLERIDTWLEQVLPMVILLSVLALMLVVVLGGCASINKHPVDVTCKGKGTITGTGYAGATIAVGGHESNTFTLQADCGEGFEYHAGPPK